VSPARALHLSLACAALVLARPVGAVQSTRERALAEFQARIEEDVAGR